MMMSAKTYLRACFGCGAPFEAKTARAKFCSGRCRVRAWKTQREREAVLADRADRDRRLQSLVEALAREVGLQVEDLG